jgi:hypothetical protein
MAGGAAERTAGDCHLRGRICAGAHGKQTHEHQFLLPRAEAPRERPPDRACAGDRPANRYEPNGHEHTGFDASRRQSRSSPVELERTHDDGRQTAVEPKRTHDRCQIAAELELTHDDERQNLAPGRSRVERDVLQLGLRL